MSIHVRVDGRNVPPDTFVDHGGVKVYRAYLMLGRADSSDETASPDPIERLFTTYSDEDPGEESCFDVAMLPEARFYDDDIDDVDVQRSIITRAIDNHHLDSVGMRGFRVDVSIAIVRPDGEEEIVDEIPMAVETMSENLPVIIASTKGLCEERPWSFYRNNGIVGCQSFKVTFLSPTDHDGR